MVGHAADLYHRNDIRRTSRQLVVRRSDRVVADTRRPLVLFESGFAPCWYVPREDIDESALTPVESETFYPYTSCPPRRRPRGRRRPKPQHGAGVVRGQALRAADGGDGSFVPFSGSAARKPAAGMLAVGATNGAADVVARGLAVGLAPVRVNAISPGTIDTGAYDGLGPQRKAELFAAREAGKPVRRIKNSGDIAQAVLFALTNFS